MTTHRGGYRNLWALTVMCLLRERSMHPYEMQCLIRQRHKDEFLDLKRGSLYHAIERLQQAGLIAAVSTSREGRRPERTVYRLTEVGERELLDWLGELLAKPLRETSWFLAALSFLPHLSQQEAQDQLRERISRLEIELVALDAIVQKLLPQIARVHLVEVEYARALRQAELTWVRSLLDDLGAGRLTWDTQALCRGAQSPPPPPPADAAGVDSLSPDAEEEGLT
jgi:DNA-binding PadR family transcriptional regulator